MWLVPFLLWLPGSMPLLPNDIRPTLKNAIPFAARPAFSCNQYTTCSPELTDEIVEKLEDQLRKRRDSMPKGASYHQARGTLPTPRNKIGKEIIVGPQVEYLVGTAPLCSRIPGLSSGQKKLCQLYQDHMRSALRGAALSVNECHWQFRNRRWNCSSVDRTNIFNPLIKVGSREAAFVNSLISAGVSHAVSMACRDGQLSSCGCSRTGRPKDLPKEWLWGGCGDDLEYGYKFTKEFLDVREKEKSLKKRSRDRDRRIMNLHNNEAGRWAVIKKARVTCKCHGMSGSCSLITCWQQLSPFREIGDMIRDKYDGAIEVKVNRRGKLQIKDPQYTSHTPNDLVYLEESPNYCVSNASFGVLGTQGRSCNRTSIGMDSCNLLCCGRGYNTQKTVVKERCQCKFHWCCHVECKTCVATIDLHTCK